MKTTYTNFSQKKLPKSRVEITASIEASVFDSYRSAALKNLNESITLDGFRKGKIPESILVQKIGDKTVREEMAEIAISHVYPEILISEKIDAIGRPEVAVKKMAAGNPLEFVITTEVIPTFELPEYKALAQKEAATFSKGPEKVTDKELDDAILRIRKSRASHEGHDHERMSAEDHEKAVMDSLPDLTDDFVRTLGDFADIPDFKDKLSKMLIEDKKIAAKEKRRIAIADAIGDKTTIELPDLLVESELDRSEAQFKADIERMGLKIEDYLGHTKKTIDDLRSEWRPHAEKKAKLQLILNAIAEKEKLRPTANEVKEEVDHILEHYKDADRERAEAYAETVLSNEKVFQWLEK